MSGIYVSGMEMPKTGYEDVRIFADGSVTATSHKPPYYWTDYRAVPVPDHGDLIDRDKLMGAKLPNNMAYQGDGRISYPPTVWQILDSISKVPTIIPGEKENSKHGET